MRIAVTTPDRLVVVSRPWVFTVGTTVLGAAPIVIALIKPESSGPETRIFLALLGAGIIFIAWKWMPLLTLDFDRSTGEVLLTEHRFTGNRTRAYELALVEKAMHQSSFSDNTRLERLALRIDGRPVAMEYAYVSDGRAKIAREINDWLTGKN